MWASGGEYTNGQLQSTTDPSVLPIKIGGHGQGYCLRGGRDGHGHGFGRKGGGVRESQAEIVCQICKRMNHSAQYYFDYYKPDSQHPYDGFQAQVANSSHHHADEDDGVQALGASPRVDSRQWSSKSYQHIRR